jgi:hypothetical protein
MPHQPLRISFFYYKFKENEPGKTNTETLQTKEPLSTQYSRNIFLRNELRTE